MPPSNREIALERALRAVLKSLKEHEFHDDQTGEVFYMIERRDVLLAKAEAATLIVAESRRDIAYGSDVTAKVEPDPMDLGDIWKELG